MRMQLLNFLADVIAGNQDADVLSLGLKRQQP
jgi:hypothetical protein